MSRLVQKTPSVCTDLPLEHAQVRATLRLLLRLLRSSLGPRAGLTLLHNSVGGAVTTTSSSSILLPALSSSSSRPLVRLLASSVRRHVSRYGDGGLFCAVFCLALVEQAGLCGVRGRVAVGLNRDLLELCVLHLHQEACGCRRRLDLGSSRGLLTLASSCMSSKPGCVLTEPEVVHLSRLSVHAFLHTVPCPAGPAALGHTVTVCVQGPCVQTSAVFPGLLVDAPDLLSWTEGPRPLPVAVFSASLSGDLSEVGGGVVEVHPGVDVDSQVLGQLLELGRRVVRDGVKVFVCQKVVHPVLQQYLRSHDVVVVERVGAALMEPLLKLTGARPVATLHMSVPAKAYGSVGNLHVRQFGSKKMLHLVPAGATSICTMVLCHRNDTMLSELKVLCQNTENVLRLTLREPYVLLGGGCTETHLAAYVRHKVRDGLSERASKLGCSQEEYLLGAEGFCRALESPAVALEHDGGNSMVDLTHAHHWILPAGVTNEDAEDSLGRCNCGLVEGGPNKPRAFLNTTRPPFSPAPLPAGTDAQPRVLDSFAAKINAMRVAVETANLVLDVRFVIQDTN